MKNGLAGVRLVSCRDQTSKLIQAAKPQGALTEAVGVYCSSPRRLERRRRGIERFLWICLAAAAGTGARYLIAAWAAHRWGNAFTYGTLIVNVSGCFVIATLMHAALELGWSPTVRSALTILGGFAAGWLGLMTARNILGH